MIRRKSLGNELTDLTDQETMLCFPCMLLVNMQRVNINQKGGIKKKRKIKNFLTKPIDERSITKF